MSKRRCEKGWLETYLQYTDATEAPKIFHFWTGISILASVVQRKVWFDMGHFQWTPNFYIILVAPPGIVNKSATINLGYPFVKFLREQGVTIHTLPESLTWQVMVQKLAAARCVFEWKGLPEEYCAATLNIGELGTLLEGKDTQMINHLVSLWDGKIGEFEKATKTSGNDLVINPWINMIAGTTPQWLTENLTQYALGGGLLSRCIFLFADKKRQYVAYPKKRSTSMNLLSLKEPLEHDLMRISELVGEMTLTPDAMEFGEQWYEEIFEKTPPHLQEAGMGGYIARKQTHVHKLAMILQISKDDSLIITKETLQFAIEMMDVLEKQLPIVYNAVGGRTIEAEIAEILRRMLMISNTLPISEVYVNLGARYKRQQIEDAVEGLVRAKYIVINTIGGAAILTATATLKRRMEQEKEKAK